MAEFQSLKGPPALIQFTLFLICGGLAALANIGIGYLLYSTLGFRTGIEYQASIIVAYLSGMLVNFFLNRHVTFRDFSRKIIYQGRTFILVAGFGLFLTVAFSSLFRASFDAFLAEPIVLPMLNVNHDAAAHVIAVALVSLYSFVGHKFMTFSRGARSLLQQARPRPREPQE